MTKRKDVDSIPTGKFSRASIAGSTVTQIGVKKLGFFARKPFVSKENRQNHQDKHDDEVVWRSGHFKALEKTIQSSLKDNGKDLDREIARVEKKVAAVELEIESVFKFQMQNTISQNAARLASERLDKLALDRKKIVELFEDLQTRRSDSVDTNVAVQGIEERLVKFKKGLAKSSEALKKRLLRGLFDVIFLKDDRLEGFYYLAESARSNPSIQTKKASGDLPEAFPKPKLKPSKSEVPANWQSFVPKVAYCGNWWT
ncbi:MAG: hypothetical protein COT74_00495 [Bdellovibrionales bacterium CG10_big_fil_rev_8_21_14_0_10_45_34]|nr:MAG: hypothetical protein COT74_00495 [Bdellovibrionales bacterium CG10_big_fil_rev_8_21_14_0_10_45_34]